MEKHLRWNIATFILGLLLFFGFYVYALQIYSQYRVDFWFILALWIGVFALREPLHLHPFHFILFGAFLLLHNLGVFRAYAWNLLGIEYDFYPHFMFGFSAFLIAYKASHLHWKRSALLHIFVFLFLILFLSMIHEAVEYTGYVTLGNGEGFLLKGLGDLDHGDSLKDMGYGMLGAVFALAVYQGWFAVKKKFID